MEKKRPNLKSLLKALEETPIKVVERATVEGEAVYGYCDGESITIGVQGHRDKGADSLIQTVIHELVHIHDENHTEREAYKWELVFFRSRALREAVAIKLLDVVVFGE